MVGQSRDSAIVVLHGLGQIPLTMELLCARLRRCFPQTEVLNFGFPSRKATLMQCVELLAEFMERECPLGSVSFVGHSTGGILPRYLDLLGISPRPLSRLVTLGSPHRGSAFARFLCQYRVARAFYGPILAELASLELPITSPHLSVCCIVGGTGNRHGFLPLMLEDNDGIVLVREAILPGAAEQHVLKVMHGLMPFSRAVAERAVAFLTGSV
jgi:hypothetical protein